LDHRIPDIENRTVDIDVREYLRSIVDRSDSCHITRDLVCGSDTADKRAAGSQTGGHLHEDCGKKSGGSNAVMEARVQVSKNADGEGTEGVCYLSVGREPLGGEEVDDVAGKSDDNHYGRLCPFRLIDDNQTHGEKRHEDK